jgi:hypothetical protein
MTAKIVAFLTGANTGCTFLDWSVLYLSGQTEFYSFLDQDYIPLTSDPVTSANAHGHEKNHLCGTETNFREIEKFLSSHNGLLTLYPWPLNFSAAAKHYDMDIKSLNLTEDVVAKFKEFTCQDFKKLWLYLHDKQSKIIYVENYPDLSLAHVDLRNSKGGVKKSSLFTTEELDKEYQEVFYADSLKTWQDLGLNNIWDERERRALDFRQHLDFTQNQQSAIPFDLPHLRINTAELWTQGDWVIKQVMAFCELEMDHSRWDHWLSVYRHWQNIFQQKILFCYRLPTILKSIVNNWYYDIGDLTFMQEVVIQHLLIYQHNLNLKTWELVKFPQNAQDLHKLLEANIHPVSDIYNSGST